jgi:DUF1680 family protein
VEQYVFVQKKDKLLVNLFVECKGSFEIGDGILEIELKTGYPWDGCVDIKLNYNGTASVCLGIRVPSWSDTFEAELNQERGVFEEKDGFIYVNQAFSEDTIRLKLDMQAKRWYANPLVENDLGKFAVSRGPLVYCMEEADNGTNLHLLSVEKQEEFEYEFDATLLEGVGVLTASGWKTKTDSGAEGLYSKNNAAEKKTKTKIKWIPYYSWANRGENEMRVWVREDYSC